VKGTEDTVNVTDTEGKDSVMYYDIARVGSSDKLTKNIFGWA